MQCEEYQIDIQRYLDNDLSEIEEIELFEHIAKCAACKKELDDYQSLHNELMQLPKVELDTSCIEDILKQIDSKTDLEIVSLNDFQTDLSKANKDILSKSVFKKYRNYITPMIAAAAVIVVIFVGKGFFSSELPYANQLTGDRMESADMVPDAEEAENGVSIFGAPDLEFRMMEDDGISKELAAQFGIDKSLLDAMPFAHEDVTNVPTEIRNWVEKSRGIFAGQSYTYKGRTYIYVSLGQRNSNDYQVSIGEIYHNNGQLYVYTQVVEPHLVNNDNRAKVYPDVLVSVTGEFIDVHFNEWQGAEIETWVPEIYGIETIPNFYDYSSDSIKIYSPESDITIEESIVIKGIARTFDGSVYYRVITNDQEEIASGFIFATRGAPDWGYFEQEIFIDLPNNIQSVQAYIEIFEISLRDGGQLGTVTVPITLKTLGESQTTEMQNKHWVTYIVTDVDSSTGLVYVEQFSVDSSGMQVPSVLDLNDVPIVRDITQEKANTVSLHAQVSDITPYIEIGALINVDGKVQQIFLFE